MFNIPPNYPFEEPALWVENPERFMHPNINEEGKVCLFGEEKPGAASHIVDRISVLENVL